MRGHMDRSEFEHLTARAAAWVANYLESVHTRPVAPSTRPGDVLAVLPERAGETPESWDAIFQDLDEIILPHTMHWQHPAFFGYFPCNTSEPAIIADLISSGLGVQGMLWQTAPAINELERRVLDQMAHAIGLPESFTSTSELGGGVIQPTASDATLAALLASRRRVFAAHPDAANSDLVLYTSDQAHSSVVKAAMIAGLARDSEDRSQIRLIPTNADYSMDTSALAEAIGADVSAGRVPTYVCATLGTTATGAFDRLDLIHDAIGRSPAWLHVDAAWAGAALVCEERREMLRGVERADSFCFNPHKWLLTTFDCDLFWTRDRRSLVDALSISPSYLRSEASESGEVFDYRDWGVPLGRRGRALKLWFVLRHYGLENLRAYIRSHIAMGCSLEALVGSDARFGLTTARSLSLVCAHALRDGEPDNDLTMAIARHINTRGQVYVTPTTLDRDGCRRATIRLAVGGTRTEPRHVELLWQELTSAHDALIDRPARTLG